ncbi:hypothetical protein [Janthinobacterium agaricidamnosum]|uniref:Uncharacterized protein n=1 Tax=Janthinobacterium agaricidamnosum NBRC 102515 = DSM 9628 TaxID=1349767 RepID=W0V5Z1_9BURK|nr:hypothetical protein [Janthinobacterium agaricidamnosum]CDG84249.1 putative uncharacterized protein [Janthinobacterium agaricidamnosum NBRC 102515 = DSM 9628]
MATDRIDPIFLSSNHAGNQPELMLSAVLHLMSHYTARNADSGACLKLASVIERHLKALAGLPDLGPVLQATCQQLSEQWAGIVERDMPQAPKSSFLSRIMSAAKADKTSAIPAALL